MIATSGVQQLSTKTLLSKGLRADGRLLQENREVKVIFDRNCDEFSPRTNIFGCISSCEVHFGDSQVIAFVTCDVVKPFDDHPNEGFFVISSNLGQISSVLDATLKDSGCVDLESLCISSGKQVFKVLLNVQVLSDCGNILDVCTLAGIGALKHFRRPDVITSKVQNFQDFQPVPLSLVHFPVSVSFLLLLDADENVVPINDATKTEEMVSNFHKFVVIVNEHEEICAVDKCGWPLVSTKTFQQCIKNAQKVSKDRLKRLLK